MGAGRVEGGPLTLSWSRRVSIALELAKEGDESDLLVLGPGNVSLLLVFETLDGELMEAYLCCLHGYKVIWSDGKPVRMTVLLIHIEEGRKSE